jgi:hypothetical protein
MHSSKIGPKFQRLIPDGAGGEADSHVTRLSVNDYNVARLSGKSGSSGFDETVEQARERVADFL